MNGVVRIVLLAFEHLNLQYYLQYCFSHSGDSRCESSNAR